MGFVRLKTLKHQTAVICKIRGCPHQKQTIAPPVDPPTWHQNIKYLKIKRWKPEHLHLVPPSKRFVQPAIRTNAYLEIAIAASILVTVNELKTVEPQGHHEFLKAWFIGKNFSLIARLGQQLQQSGRVIQFYVTTCEPRIDLLANAKTAKSTAIAYE